jgi:hypothetical protein
VLLAAFTRGGSDLYAAWRTDHLATEHGLKVSGLLRSPHGPHRVEVHPDVRYSLEPRSDAPYPEPARTGGLRSRGGGVRGRGPV